MARALLADQFGEALPSGSSERCPQLHICCVGEPPPSVWRLSARAGAVISIHEPLRGLIGGYANKIRGLDNAGLGARLLVDVDVLVLGGLDLFDSIGADFAAAVAGKPQVPHSVWERIYHSLNLPLPRERTASLYGRFGLRLESVSHRYDGQENETAAMLPYFNSGVLRVRGECGLRERWEDHLRRILRLAADRPEMMSLHAVMFGDQVALATALQSLQAEGRTLSLLPDSCNVRRPHLRAGAMRWRDIRLLHATELLKDMRTRVDLPIALENYIRVLETEIAAGAPISSNADDGDRDHPRHFLLRLWERWVRPEWGI